MRRGGLGVVESGDCLVSDCVLYCRCFGIFGLVLVSTQLTICCVFAVMNITWSSSRTASPVRYDGGCNGDGNGDGFFCDRNGFFFCVVFLL